jgi:hypothetical protein
MLMDTLGVIVMVLLNYLIPTLVNFIGQQILLEIELVLVCME